MFWLGFCVGLSVGATIGLFTAAIIKVGRDPEMSPAPHKETCRERLAREHPVDVQDKFIGGCIGCPSVYGYASDPSWCEIGNRVANCTKCWDRPVEVE